MISFGVPICYRTNAFFKFKVVRSCIILMQLIARGARPRLLLGVHRDTSLENGYEIPISGLLPSPRNPTSGTPLVRLGLLACVLRRTCGYARRKKAKKPAHEPVFCNRQADCLMPDTMLDILMVAMALAFFALSIGYAYACDQL
jgi:hypothetical protein